MFFICFDSYYTFAVEFYFKYVIVRYKISQNQYVNNILKIRECYFPLYFGSIDFFYPTLLKEVEIKEVQKLLTLPGDFEIVFRQSFEDFHPKSLTVSNLYVRN